MKKPAPSPRAKPRVTLLIEPPGKPPVRVEITDEDGLDMQNLGLIAITPQNDRHERFTDDFVLIDVPHRRIIVGAGAHSYKIGIAIWRAIYFWGRGWNVFDD